MSFFVLAPSVRNRTHIDTFQAEILRKFLEKNPFPNSEERFLLEQQTGLPAKVIQVWFKNRRRENRGRIIK